MLYIIALLLISNVQASDESYSNDLRRNNRVVFPILPGALDSNGQVVGLGLTPLYKASAAFKRRVLLPQPPPLRVSRMPTHHLTSRNSLPLEYVLRHIRLSGVFGTPCCDVSGGFYSPANHRKISIALCGATQNPTVDDLLGNFMNQCLCGAPTAIRDSISVQEGVLDNYIISIKPKGMDMIKEYYAAIKGTKSIESFVLEDSLCRLFGEVLRK